MRASSIGAGDERTVSLPPAGPGRRGHGRRGVIAASTLAVTLAVGVVLGVTDPFASKASTSGTAAYPTSTATVTRQDLSSQTNVNGTLGYAGDYSVVNQAQGTITALPAVGQVISEGQVLYRVSNNPVVLLYGATPAYRALSEGTTGPDVAELNADLVALGYVTSSALPPATATFTYWTVVGVEDLQAALGETASGTLALGQAVFLPTAARITTISATLGAQAPPGQTIFKASSTARQVSIDLNADQQSEVKAGDHVTITLPNNQTTPGLISSVGTVATAPSSSGGSGSTGSSASSTPTIIVLVAPTDPAGTGSWDQAPVTITITTASVTNVLVVPVDALFAQPGGGFALEVVRRNGTHRLVRVSLGLFDNAQGLVQVSGAGLSVGQHVVVPGL